MQQFKIDAFLDDNPEGNFPHCRALAPAECHKILSELKTRLGVPQETLDISVLKRVRSESVTLEGVDADSEGFDLLELVKGKVAGVDVAKVYLNWYRFDDIDEIDLEALASHWNYIWYPGPDDIEIFEESLDWILSVDHSGAVYWYETPTASSQVED
jgi:hypothetical protein